MTNTKIYIAGSQIHIHERLVYGGVVHINWDKELQ